MPIASGRLPSRMCTPHAQNETLFVTIGSGTRKWEIKGFIRRSFSAPGTAQSEVSPNVHKKTAVVLLRFAVPGSEEDMGFSGH